MVRIEKIRFHTQYIEFMNRNAEYESTRIFCHHDFQHVLDVARIAYILALENKLSILKEVIYAASLLHDIGRWKEYAEGVDHASESAILASPILVQCGFTREECDSILFAIGHHRTKGQDQNSLGWVLFEADKKSRLCCKCLTRETCKRFQDHHKPILHY